MQTCVAAHVLHSRSNYRPLKQPCSTSSSVYFRIISSGSELMSLWLLIASEELPLESPLHKTEVRRHWLARYDPWTESIGVFPRQTLLMGLWDCGVCELYEDLSVNVSQRSLFTAAFLHPGPSRHVQCGAVWCLHWGRRPQRQVSPLEAGTSLVKV